MGRKMRVAVFMAASVLTAVGCAKALVGVGTGQCLTGFNNHGGWRRPYRPHHTCPGDVDFVRYSPARPVTA